MTPIRGTWRTWLAWSMAACVMVFTVLHLALWTLADAAPRAVDSRGRAGISIPFAVVGALIITRRPGNGIGWLFCGIGFSFSLHGALDAYALYAAVGRPEAGLPGARAAAWLVLWSRKVEVVLAFVFLPLLYPNGRLPSSRWRPVAWLAALSLLLMMISDAFRPGLVQASEIPVGPSPLGIAGAGQVLDGLEVVAVWMLSLPAAVAAAASVVLRFRHAQGVERLQLKWFVYAIVSILTFDLLGSALLAVLSPSRLILDLIESAVALGLPIALGIAVLRYRLYDIDRLVNRTLVYGLVTVLLGLVYIAGVFILAPLLNPTDGDSELAVAASTLAVAALFRPLRHRVQSLVDRRFNRRHYDATRTIEAFATSLNKQIDLDTLATELLDVVNETVEPVCASLWLRPINSTHATTPCRPSLRLADDMKR
jgi:hypothetical protein